MFNIITIVYETGELPEDFLKCVMIPILKKQKAKKCEEYRTLSLISYALKVLTKIVHKRIEKKIENNLTEDLERIEKQEMQSCTLEYHRKNVQNKQIYIY